MMVESLVAVGLLGLLVGAYTASRVAGHYWDRVLKDQTVAFAAQLAETEQRCDEKILAYERTAMQLGTQVLANACVCPSKDTLVSWCPIHASALNPRATVQLKAVE